MDGVKGITISLVWQVRFHETLIEDQRTRLESRVEDYDPRLVLIEFLLNNVQSCRPIKEVGTVSWSSPSYPFLHPSPFSATTIKGPYKILDSLRSTSNTDISPFPLFMFYCDFDSVEQTQTTVENRRFEKVCMSVESTISPPPTRTILVDHEQGSPQGIEEDETRISVFTSTTPSFRMKTNYRMSCKTSIS